MNDIFTSHIQVTRGQTRDAAAVELKSFLNDVLSETHPELGRVERVTIPQDYNDNLPTCFGFVSMCDRRAHVKFIEMFDRVEFKCRPLMMQLGRKTPAITCQAVRESRRRFQEQPQTVYRASTGSATRSATHSPTRASLGTPTRSATHSPTHSRTHWSNWTDTRTSPLRKFPEGTVIHPQGLGRGLLMYHRPKTVTFATASPSSVTQMTKLRHQMDKIVATILAKTAENARRTEEQAKNEEARHRQAVVQERQQEKEAAISRERL